MMLSVLYFILASSGLLKMFNIGWDDGENVQYWLGRWCKCSILAGTMVQMFKFALLKLYLKSNKWPMRFSGRQTILLMVGRDAVSFVDEYQLLGESYCFYVHDRRRCVLIYIYIYIYTYIHIYIYIYTFAGGPWAFPLKILDNVSSSGRGAEIGASSYSLEYFEGD